MNLEEEALKYHEQSPRGKIYTGLSKPLSSQLDLTLAYSPGVAAPCRKIADNPEDSFRYTGRANLVAVISNGTAVLGLGNIGPYAAKPVMEGKAMLFKKFADIDVFDIELNLSDPDDFIKAVKGLEPTFGGINLEDIKSPECFYIEERLREQMSIPVFHDDQHGTAIIAASAFLNALEVTGRNIKNARVVFSGSGAAATATANLFLQLGVKKQNLIMTDSQGVVYVGRQKGMNPYKEKLAIDTKLRTLEEALTDADAFIGVSAANVLTPQMIKKMAKNPIIFALANPDPEIHPELARQHRPDAIIATGRSDFPNQVNNVLGFPFIFRGALDVSAKCINEEMKMAAVKAIAELAKEDVPEEVTRVYKNVEGYHFGRDYLIPKPVDSRVLLRVAPAVAKAAMDSGVARKHIDIDKYCEQIERILGPTKKIIRQLRMQIQGEHRNDKPLIVIPRGKDERVIRAAVQIYREADVRLCLLGQEEEILKLAQNVGFNDFKSMVQIVDPLTDERISHYAEHLFQIRMRKGVTKAIAETLLRNPNYFAGLMLFHNEVDGIVAGLSEPYSSAVRPILEVIDLNEHEALAGIYMIVIKKKMYFFADCTIHPNPTAAQLADIAFSTVKVARRYTDEPMRVAMLSFSSFGSNRLPETIKVAEAVNLVKQQQPDFVIEGEMQADVALNRNLQSHEFPFCALEGEANVLIFPDLSSANIAYKLLANLADAALMGPILSGVKQPVNVLQRGATTEELVNMIYLTADEVVAKRASKFD